MHGVYIAERWRVHEHVVPCRLEPVGLRNGLQREICREPWRILEVMKMRQAFDQVRGKKRGSGKYHGFPAVLRVAAKNSIRMLSPPDPTNSLSRERQYST